MNRISWKEIMLGTIAGLSLLTSPAVGQMSSATDGPAMWMDNRGPGLLNSGPGSMGSRHDVGDHRGRHGHDPMVIAQATDDIRQEDRREDRRMGRREDRQMDRREDRQEDRRSNSGGELRGLDRADHVAGEHGREGRDNARMMQMERPNRPDRVERMERPERPDRPDRPDRPERPKRPERAGRH